MTVSLVGTVSVEISTDAEKNLMIQVLNYGKDNIASLTDDQKNALSAVAGALNSIPSLG